jgi:hypothetical protein
MLWDDAQYAAAAIRMHDGLVTGGVGEFLKRFVEALRGKAPFLSVGAVPFLLLFGRESDWGFEATVLASLVVAGLFAYRLGRYFTTPSGSLVGVMFLYTLPSVVGLSRQFMVEIPLAAAVLAWHFYILESDFLSKAGSTIVLGVVLGVGMLIKITFPLFIVGSVATIITAQRERLGVGFREFRRAVCWGTLMVVGMFLIGAYIGRVRAYIGVMCALAALWMFVGFRCRSMSAEAKRWLLIGVIAVGIAGSWYTVNLDTAGPFAWSASLGKFSRDYYVPLGTAFGELVSYGLSALHVLFLGGGILVLSCRGWTSTQGGVVSSRRGVCVGYAWLMLALWFVIPLVGFVISANRNYRLILPCLLPMSLMGGKVAEELVVRWSLARRLVLPAFLAAVVAQFAAYSFGLGYRGRVEIGPLVIWGGQLGWDQRPPSRVEWPHEAIVRVMDSLLAGSRNRRVLLLFNQPETNRLNLELAALRARKVLIIDGAERFSNMEVGEEAGRGYGIVVAKAGGMEGQESIEGIGPELGRRAMRGDIDWLEVADRIDLPDGGRLLFYRSLGGS